MSNQRMTSSGIEIPQFLEKLENKSLENPGKFPFTRGIHSGMYRSKLWTMRQYAGFSTAKESNTRYKELLAKGALGLSCAFDLPTQMGHDSDQPIAKGEVGKVGVAIDSIDDMRTLLDGIDLRKVSTSMTINATASTLLAMYECVAEEKGVSSKEISGTIQNDILKEYIARGTYIFPPAPSMRLITDIFKYCSEYVPKWNTISISGYHIREAGSTAAQEIAFTLANGITYVESALKAGLKLDDFASRLSFFFNVHNNFLEEIAKFRAARRMWAKIMKEKFQASDERSMMLRFHSQVAGSTLTAQQPLNNVVRVTLQAMASVLGGTQSLHTNAYDEALQLPTSSSAELALRTQQIIAYESGVTDTVDPFAGSYIVEHLTNELESYANSIIEEIFAKGGVIECIKNGFIVNEIMNASYREQLRIEKGESKIVGVNSFQETVGSAFKIPSNKISAEIEKEQVLRLKAFKAQRNMQNMTNALSNLELVAKSEQNLMVAIKNCVKNNCTVGEISHTLRKVFGEYKAPQL